MEKPKGMLKVLIPLLVAVLVGGTIFAVSKLKEEPPKTEKEQIQAYIREKAETEYYSEEAISIMLYNGIEVTDSEGNTYTVREAEETIPDIIQALEIDWDAVTLNAVKAAQSDGFKKSKEMLKQNLVGKYFIPEAVDKAIRTYEHDNDISWQKIANEKAKRYYLLEAMALEDVEVRLQQELFTDEEVKAAVAYLREN